MGDLTPKILELVARLSGREESGLAPAPPRDRAATEGTYRETLRRWWELTAQGAEADLDAITQAYQALLRLLDEVGEPTATRLRREWARQWWYETGRCPWCGEAGPYHDPDLGGESA